MQIDESTFVNLAIKPDKNGVPTLRVIFEAEAEALNVGELARMLGQKVTVYVRSSQLAFSGFGVDS